MKNLYQFNIVEDVNLELIPIKISNLLQNYANVNVSQERINNFRKDLNRIIYENNYSFVICEYFTNSTEIFIYENCITMNHQLNIVEELSETICTKPKEFIPNGYFIFDNHGLNTKMIMNFENKYSKMLATKHNIVLLKIDIKKYFLLNLDYDYYVTNSIIVILSATNKNQYCEIRYNLDVEKDFIKNLQPFYINLHLENFPFKKCIEPLFDRYWNTFISPGAHEISRLRKILNECVRYEHMKIIEYNNRFEILFNDDSLYLTIKINNIAND